MKRILIVAIFAMFSTSGYANSALPAGSASVLPSPNGFVLAIEGSAAKALYETFVDAGLPWISCAGGKAYSNATMTCAIMPSEGAMVYDCRSLVLSSGTMTPDSSMCPTPSIIGVSN